MRSRAVLLPTGAGKAYGIEILNLWTKFLPNWRKEFDNFILYQNSDYHGPALEHMLSQVEEEYIMLIEDDAYVIKSGAVDRYFSMLESGEYDVIGSPRMSCSPVLAEAARERFDLDYTGYGDKGPNFWPCFLFTRTELLKQVSGGLRNKGWGKGEYIEELDWTATEDVGGDTFVGASLQLRAMGLKILEIPQWHCHLYDLAEYKAGTGMWNPDADAPWIHVGSLSGDLVDPLPGDIVAQWDQGRRRFFLDIAKGEVNDTERYEAYKLLLGDAI